MSIHPCPLSMATVTAFCLVLGACGSSEGESPGSFFGQASAPGSNTGAGSTDGPDDTNDGTTANPSDGSDPPSGDPAPTGGLCSPCETADDCTEPGADCVVNNDTGDRFCGSDCSSDSCPAGYTCVDLSDTEISQCVPESGTCPSEPTSDGGDSGSGSEQIPGPTADTCDPGFMGPFCDNDRIIGFDPEAPKNPTKQEAREYSVKAVNYIRSLTCLPPLALDSCLTDIAEKALAANSGHGYFQANCLNAAHNFGRDCECNWTQENIGMAAGSSRTWVDGVHVPLCGMMTEPKGVGHRSNIEHEEWTRMGVGITLMSGGASWFHEFGN